MADHFPGWHRCASGSCVPHFCSDEVPKRASSVSQRITSRLACLQSLLPVALVCLTYAWVTFPIGRTFLSGRGVSFSWLARQLKLPWVTLVISLSCLRWSHLSYQVAIPPAIKPDLTGSYTFFFLVVIESYRILLIKTIAF